MMLVPQFVEARSSCRLDAADDVQVSEIIAGQPAAVNLIGARVDLAAPLEAAPEIDPQVEIGEPFVARTLPQTAGRIAEHLAGLGDADRQSGLAKPMPEFQIDQLLIGIARILRLALGTGFRRNLRTVVSF